MWKWLQPFSTRRRPSRWLRNFKLREGSFPAVVRSDLLVAVRLVPPDVHLPAAGVRGGVPAHLLEEPLQCWGWGDWAGILQLPLPGPWWLKVSSRGHQAQACPTGSPQPPRGRWSMVTIQLSIQDLRNRIIGNTSSCLEMVTSWSLTCCALSSLCWICCSSSAW